MAAHHARHRACRADRSLALLAAPAPGSWPLVDPAPGSGGRAAAVAWAACRRRLHGRQAPARATRHQTAAGPRVAGPPHSRGRRMADSTQPFAGQLGLRERLDVRRDALTLPRGVSAACSQAPKAMTLLAPIVIDSSRQALDRHHTMTAMQVGGRWSHGGSANPESFTSWFLDAPIPVMHERSHEDP